MDYTRRTISCTTSENQVTEGYVERRDLSLGERIQRGLKVGGILWLIAVFAVFIPVLHFVLVPGFAIAGLVFGLASGSSKGEISEGHFSCPNCKRENALGRMSESFPYSVRCQGCSFILKLEIVGRGYSNTPPSP